MPSLKLADWFSMKNILLFALLVPFQFIDACALRAETSHQDSTEYLKQNKHFSLKLTMGKRNIYIHYPQDKKEFALEVKKIVEEDFPKIHHYFDYTPQEDVHFVVSGYKEANGFATVFPRNKVILHDYPPVGWGNLSYSKDWVKTLVIHEYTHILTLEMTGGIFNPLRKVFGSTVKVAGVVPLWFSEGIAVWSESEFSQEGRLRNPLIRYQVAQALHDPKTCKSIDCLDEIKVLPYGSYPYNVGAYFLSYIEKKWPSSLSCIFKGNSKKIPFFLNSTFKKCHGQDIYQTWDEFLIQTKKDLASEVNHCPFKNKQSCYKLAKSKIADEYRIDWSKGFVESTDYAAVVGSSGSSGEPIERGERTLLIFDWKRNKIKKLKQKYPVEKIYAVQQNNPESFVLTRYTLDSGAPKRVHDLYQFKSSQIYLKRDFAQGIKGAYVLPLGKDKFYQVYYDQSRWNIEKVDKEGENPILISKRDFLENIFSPRVGAGGEFISYDKHRLNTDALVLNDGKSVNEKGITQIPQEYAYNHIDHFDLTYLLLFFSYDSNLSLLTASSTISDPLGKMALALNLKYYSGLEDNASPLRFGASYSVNFPGQWGMSFSFDEVLGKTPGFTQTDVARAFGFALSKRYYFGRYRGLLGIGGTSTDKLDVISGQRKANRLYIAHKLNFRNDRLRALLNSWSWSISPFFEKNSLDQNFFGLSTGLDLGLNLAKNLNLTLSGHYGKYFKDTSKGGFIYGGGASSTLTGLYTYESYGLEYGALLGNEVWTSRSELKYTFARPMRGWGLFPLFINSWSVLGGFELAGSDFVYNPFYNSALAKRAETDPSISRSNPEIIPYFRDKILPSYFVGIELKTHLAYRFPADFKLVYSRIDYEGNVDSRISFLLSTPLIP